jgi:hypothetical protein
MRFNKSVTIYKSDYNTANDEAGLLEVIKRPCFTLFPDKTVISKNADIGFVEMPVDIEITLKGLLNIHDYTPYIAEIDSDKYKILSWLENPLFKYTILRGVLSKRF